MHMQIQNQQPVMYVAKQQGTPAIGTTALPYRTVGDGIQAAERLGKRTVQVKPDEYLEAVDGTGAFVIDKPVTLVADGGIVTIRATNMGVSAADAPQTNLLAVDIGTESADASMAVYLPLITNMTSNQTIEISMIDEPITPMDTTVAADSGNKDGAHIYLPLINQQ